MGILVHSQLLGARNTFDCGYLQGVGRAGRGREGSSLILDTFALFEFLIKIICSQGWRFSSVLECLPSMQEAQDLFLVLCQKHSKNHMLCFNQ